MLEGLTPHDDEQEWFISEARKVVMEEREREKLIRESEYINGHEAGARSFTRYLYENYDGVDKETLRVLLNRFLTDHKRFRKYRI